MSRTMVLHERVSSRQVGLARVGASRILGENIVPIVVWGVTGATVYFVYVATHSILWTVLAGAGAFFLTSMAFVLMAFS